MGVIIGTPAKHLSNGFSLGGLVIYSGIWILSLPSSTKKIPVKIGPPLTKSSGSVHGLFFKFLRGYLLLKATNLIVRLVRLNKICDQVESK